MKFFYMVISHYNNHTTNNTLAEFNLQMQQNSD